MRTYGRGPDYSKVSTVRLVVGTLLVLSGVLILIFL